MIGNADNVGPDRPSGPTVCRASASGMKQAELIPYKHLDRNLDRSLR